jgi:hypothetical protein
VALQNTNLIIQGAQLPAAFRGKPNDFFQAILERMKIVSPFGTSFIVVGDVEPTSNQGPWLKGGTQWYVYDTNLKRYVPLDISASDTEWYQVGSTTPVSTTPPLWLKTTEGVTIDEPTPGTPVAWYLYDGTNWIQLPVLIPDRAVTREQLFWTANYFGTASGINNYTLTFSPATNFTLGDGANSTFAFYVKFANTNTGAVTLNVNSAGPIPVKKFTNEDIAGGEIKAGVIHLLTFDGTNFQLLSSLDTLESGIVLNTETNISNTMDSTGITIPNDNTIPQKTEGAPFADLSTVFVARRANSKLVIDVDIFASIAGTDSAFIFALFRDDESDAITTTAQFLQDGFSSPIRLRAIFDVNDVLSHTYKVRYGSSSTAPATASINGTSFGGTLVSSLTITEVSA